MERLFISSLFLWLLSSPVFANEDAPPISGRSLFFETENRTLIISEPRISYDLKQSKGKSLDFGNGIIFNDDSLNAHIENNKLELKWDSRLISSGELTVINDLGKEIWKRQISTVGSWSFDKLQTPEAPQWHDGEKFKFCLRTEKERGHANLCTATYAIEIKDSALVLGRSRSDTSARIIFQNEESSLKDSKTVAIGQPVQFLATLQSGASYDFVSEPSRPILKDLAKADGKLHLKGELPAPLHSEVKIIAGENYSSTSQFFGFQKTVGIKPDLWEVTIPEKEALLSLPGKSGGLFVYSLQAKDVPLDSERLFISDNIPAATYLAKDQFLAKNSQGETIIWEFEAPQKNSMNKIVLQNSYLDVYRGSPREASLRYTGVSATDSSFILLGEVQFSWWFNDLFGWQNELISRQRWGFTLNYMSTLMDFDVTDNQDTKEKLGLSALKADLRYRLNPGLSGRDDTWGLILAYESVTLASDNVPKMGVGTFWSRSMPSSLDKWISKLPFMDAPKWVDFEVLTFPMAMDSDVTLKEDFALNFHGKVLWTSKWFGEAGFGLKNYHYEFSSTGYGAKVTTIYGNLGLGLQF